MLIPKERDVSRSPAEVLIPVEYAPKLVGVTEKACATELTKVSPALLDVMETEGAWVELGLAKYSSTSSTVLA